MILFDDLKNDDVKNDDVKKLANSLKRFSEDCATKSEQCKFWIMGVIKNLIKADREGDFLFCMRR